MTAEFAVLAKAVALPPATEGLSKFVYMPAGKNVLTPSVNGKAEKVTVMVDAETAEVLQSALAERLQNGPPPPLDYDHTGGRASGWPKSFSWEEGVGVICHVEWTEQAKASIRGGEYRYFSPEFRWDRTTKKVSGLTAGYVGGLVNDPAFRSIPAIAARNANNLPGPDGQEPPQTTHTMTQNDKIVAALIAAGHLSDAEAAGDKAASLLCSRIADWKKEGDTAAVSARNSVLADKDKRISDLESQIAAANKEKAEGAVKDAIKAGRIAPKDEKSITFWTESIMANSNAVHALNSLPENPVLKATQATGSEKQIDTTDRSEEVDDRITAAAGKLYRESNGSRSYRSCYDEAERAETAASKN